MTYKNIYLFLPKFTYHLLFKTIIGKCMHKNKSFIWIIYRRSCSLKNKSKIKYLWVHCYTDYFYDLKFASSILHDIKFMLAFKYSSNLSTVFWVSIKDMSRVLLRSAKS